MGKSKWYSVHLLGQLALSVDVCEGLLARDDLEDNLIEAKINIVKVQKEAI